MVFCGPASSFFARLAAYTAIQAVSAVQACIRSADVPPRCSDDFRLDLMKPPRFALEPPDGAPQAPRISGIQRIHFPFSALLRFSPRLRRWRFTLAQ